jgi:hypothetical protein
MVNAITTAFNEGLRQLLVSVHGIMPDDAIVLNAITCLCIARKQCGFTEDETRDAIVAAFNQNMVWAKQFGGEK